MLGGERRGEGAYSFVACLSHLTVDHASLSRRSTVPTPDRDTSNVWVLNTFLPLLHKNALLNYFKYVSCEVDKI